MVACIPNLYTKEQYIWGILACIDFPKHISWFVGLFKELLLWTGIKKGPPRKLKFPLNTDLIEEVKKKL